MQSLQLPIPVAAMHRPTPSRLTLQETDAMFAQPINRSYSSLVLSQISDARVCVRSLPTFFCCVGCVYVFGYVLCSVICFTVSVFSAEKSLGALFLTHWLIGMIGKSRHHGNGSREYDYGNFNLLLRSL